MDDNEKNKAQLIAELQELRKEKEFVRSMYHRNIQGAEQSTILLHDIIEKNPVSIQIVDKEGYTIIANHAHSQLFQAKPDVEYSIFKDKQLLAQGLDEYFERLKKGKEVEFPDTIYNAGDIDPAFPDNPINIKVLGFPLFNKDRQPEQFVIMHVDITKEKKLQHDLEVNNLQLNNLTEYLNTIREDEREYLSAEIHDKFSTALATITRRMTAMKQNIADEETLKKIDYILFTADDARNIVSKLIAEIRTDKLKNLGLITAIRAYARYFEENNPIKVKLFTEEIKDADPAATHVLYRIVQESLNNVASHAKASVVEIYLKQKKGRLHCKIADNGVGISVKDIDLSKDHCIYFMQKRVENLGGKFSISGKKNKGTTINFDLPVKKKIRNENIDL